MVTDGVSMLARLRAQTGTQTKQDAAVPVAAPTTGSDLLASTREYARTRKTAGTALREFADRPLQAVPYLSGLSDASLMARVHRVGRAVEAGEVLPAEDEEFLREFLLDAQRPQTVGYMATKLIAQLPAMMGEFLSSGGAASAGRAAGQAGARRIMGQAMREGVERVAKTETLRDAAMAAGRTQLAEKLAVRLAAARAATPMAARALDATAGAVGSVAGRVAQFGAVDALLGGGRISANAYQRAMPELGLQETERGDLAIAVYAGGREFLDALPEAILDQFIEVGSEMSGGALAKLPLIDRARTAASRVAASWIARNNPQGSKVDAFLKVLDKAGWQGPIAEYLEERVGDTARAATGLGDWEDIWPGLDQSAAELIAFSVPGAVVGMAEGARQRIERGRAVPRETGAKFREEAAAAKPTGEIEDVEQGVAEWARASGVRGARPVAEADLAPEERDAADLARALGTDLRIVDGDNIAESQSRGALLGRGFAVMARGTATPEAVVFHEVAHVARRRSPEDWDAMRARLVEVAPEFMERAEAAWEQTYRASVGRVEGQDRRDPGYAQAMSYAVGSQAQLDTPPDADTRAEEGVSTAAEWLAPVLSYGVTPEGRADLQRVLAAEPTFLARVKEAVVDVIARLVGARGAQTRRAATQRLRDVLADSEASDLGVERAARMALDILDTIEGVEARRAPGSRMGFEEQGPAPQREEMPIPSQQTQDRAAEKAERRARQRQWKALRETESRARGAEEAAALGLGPDERTTALAPDIEVVLGAARERRVLAEAARRVEAQRAAQAVERAARPKQSKPRGERVRRVVEDTDPDVLPVDEAAAVASAEDESAAAVGLGPDQGMRFAPALPPATRAKASAAMLATRQMFQDRTIRLRDLMDQNGIATGTAEDADLHGALDLAISRAGASQEALTERVLKMLAPFRGRDLGAVQRVAAAYSAPQRNAWMMAERGVRNASGVSDAEAQQIEATERATLGSARVDRFLDELRSINREHLDLMVEAQVLTRDAADKWHTREPHYLSLRDMAEELEGDLRGFQPAGRSAAVRGPLFRKAEGRIDLAGDALLAWHTSKLAQIDAAHRNKALAEQGVALAGEFTGQDDPPVKLVRKSEHVGPKDPEGGIAFFLGGERAWLVFADTRVADALKGLDAKQVGWALGALGKVTRTFSRGVTARNPFFWPRNFLRDTLGAAFNVAAGEGRTAVDAARLVGSAWRDLPQIIRHALGRATPMAARIERAQRAGYKTTWAQRDAKDLQAAMQDALAEKKTPGQRARAFFRALDRMSDAFEQATRLAAFEYELERTGSEAKAALYAKRITVNFDMRGDATSALSTVFAFFNPAVQGATRLLEAIRSPQGAKLAGGIVAVGMLSEILGFALSDDDEATGLPDFAGVSEFERSRSLVAPFEVAGVRPKLLLPYGLGAIFASGRRMAHLASHMAGAPLDPGYTANQAAFDTVTQLVREWVPIDTTGGVAGVVTPTIASPFIDIEFNTSFTGKPLMPQASSFGRTLPDSARYFSTLEDTFSGILAKGIADVLNLGGSEKLPTGLDVSPESVQRVLAEIMAYVGLGLSEADRASQFVLSKRPATVVWTPLLRDLVTESTDYFVSERFYQLRDRGSQMRSAAADGPDGAREARAMDPALWKVLDGLEAAHKRTGDLRRKIREADTRTERRELRDRLTAVQARALRRYYAALDN